MMFDISRLAKSVLYSDPVETRLIVCEALADLDSLSDVTLPDGLTDEELSVAAGLLELFCQRNGILPPAWTDSVKGIGKQVYLIKAASRMPRLRKLCKDEGPEPLRKRGVYAPPDYLTSA